MYKWLGYISVALVVFITSPYWLRKLNGWTFKTKDKRFFNLLKFLRKLHKPLGVLLGLVSFWHAMLALGSLRIHTGLLAFVGFILTVGVGFLFWINKNKKVFKLHKTLALLSILFLIVHLLWPSALWYLFRI